MSQNESRHMYDGVISNVGFFEQQRNILAASKSYFGLFNIVLQYVAVRCSMLQCVAVFFPRHTSPSLTPCCSVWSCCSALQGVAVCCSVLQCIAVCCSVLQCVAVCCNVVMSYQILASLHSCTMGCCKTLQHIATHCSTLQHTAAHGNMLSYQILASSSNNAIVCSFGATPDKSMSSASLHSVLQCVAVCCSVLQCVAVCCSVLQCVAVSFNVLQ